MKDVKVAKDFYVPKEKVKFYTAYVSKHITDEIRRKKKTSPESVIDYTCGKKTMSVIYLVTGDIILVNTAIDTIAARMNEEG